MKLDFSKEQVSLLNNIDLGFDVTEKLSYDEILEIDEKVSD